LGQVPNLDHRVPNLADVIWGKKLKREDKKKEHVNEKMEIKVKKVKLK
jgi:hypothetical protein